MNDGDTVPSLETPFNVPPFTLTTSTLDDGFNNVKIPTKESPTHNVVGLLVMSNDILSNDVRQRLQTE